MRWIHAAGFIGVLLVIGLSLGGAANLALSSLLTSDAGTSVLATLAVMIIAFVIVVALAGPEREWTENPYW